MRLKGYILLLFTIIYSHGLIAQVKGDYTQSRVLILLDRSSSMIQQWGGVKSKSKAADELILRLMDSVYQVNPYVEFSLRVFGHQFTVPENNCHDTKNEVPFSKNNRVRMAYRLEDIQPLGVTSIAYSLKQAAEFDLVDEARNAYSILLITDGGESCGGDICEVMRTLVNSKVYFKPYIISLEDYAPLKATYSCMGNYLQVLKESDMRPAIGVIVDAFKPVLDIRPPNEKEIQNIVANAPSILKVNTPTPAPPAVPAPTPAPVPAPAPKPISAARLSPVVLKPLAMATPQGRSPQRVTVPQYEPVKVAEIPVEQPKPVEEKPVRPAPQKITNLSPLRMKPTAISSPVITPLRIVAIPVYEPVIVAEEPPARPAPQKIAYAGLSRLRLVATAAPVTRNPKLAIVPELPKPVLVIDTPVTPKAIDKIARLQPVKIHQFGIIWVVEEHSFPMHAVPPLPPFKFDAPPVAKPVAKPTPATEADGKAAEYTVDRVEAKETTVQVYFTNGKGKFFATTPQVLLMDDASGKLIKRFYRTVDANGEPDPQPGVPPGNYNLTFSETRGMTVRNVKVEEHKNNKIMVKVNNASLSFEYADALNRPVTEFAATVIERNKPQGRVQNQKCSEKLEYEPGNYHVIINTFPQDVRNLDLDFSEKVIKIPQPGFASFNAEPGINSVVLYQRLGDKFLSFHTQNLNDPKAKHMSIQPGEYQAHYRKGPGGAAASEKVVIFFIKPTQETVIELK